jgi:nucleotide-binding universal stress UspA family protein
MTEQHRYKIVVGVDFSEMSEVVLETALDLAARHEFPEIHVLSVLAAQRWPRKPDQVDQSSELAELERALRSLLGEKLADFGRSFETLEGWRVYVHTRVGSAADQIASLAWEAEAEIIVLGRHGESGWRRFLLGTVPEHVLRLARCPVLIVQPTDYGLAEPELELEQMAEQCAECVAARHDSDGGQWFCTRHSDYRLSRSTYMARSNPTLPIGGGPLL